ncbi:MAG: hypothetical protein RL628_1761 [Actinomycetota bacterium]
MKKLVAVIVVIGLILMSRSIVHASDGDLDASWGGTGVVVSTHATESAAYAIANYPDNRVLVVGSVTDSPASRILANRFLADGSADTTCNNTGQLVDTVNDAVASDVVVLSDGSFVITGTMQINNKGALFVARFTNTCSFDTTFGNNGIATYSAGDGTSARALTVQPDGKIIVVGDEYPTVSDSNDQRILVARFSAVGIIDNSFGLNGRFISTANQKGQAQDVVIDSNGRIIFTGSIVGTVAPDAAIVGRLTSNGQLDSTFATLGYFINEFNGDAQLNAIALRPNGNLVAVGTYGGPSPSAQQSPIVVCLTQTGAFDSDCGVNGWAYLPTANSDVYADDVIVTSDNKILLSGMINPTNPQPFVMRLNHNGTLDNNFATSGTWRGTSLIGRMFSVTIQSDGRILAAGQLDAQGTMSVGVVRLANTVVVTTTTTVAPLVTTSTTIPQTTVVPEQLPATGSRFDYLTVALLLTALGSIVIASRRRTSH